MRKIRDKSYSEKLKRDEELNVYRVKCECGWYNNVYNKNRKTICKNCGRYVFFDKKEEFKYRLKNI